MTNAKSTKHALLTSVMALFLCFTMLLGTTFAWFTDTVVSNNNIITAGNLDVELYYQNDETDDWTVVNADTNIFKDTLWEPGHTEVVYFKVVNAGSLAFKYQLGINILNEIEGTNQANKTFKLSDYIMFGVVEGVNGETGAYTKDDAGRADAIADVTAAKKISAGYTKAASMQPGNALYLALVVYMPETVGNVANHNGTDIPKIDLGINVFATQLTAENDSFNNQYDAAAPWTGIIPDKIPESLVIDVGEDAKDQTGTITIKSPEALVYLSKLAKEWVSLYSNGQGTDFEKYYVSNGGKGTDYYYHSQWNVVLDADLDMSNIPMDTINISYWGSFDGNGHTISNIVLKDGKASLFDKGIIKDLNIKNIVVNAPSASTVGAVFGSRGSLSNVHVVNATVNGGKYVGGLAGKGSNFTNCSIKNSTVTGTDKTVGGLVGYSIGDPGVATVTGNTVENVIVTGAYNVGGLLGQSQNETVENNTIKNVTVKSTLELPASASSNEVRTAKVAARSNFAGTVIGANTVENVTLIDVANVSDNAGLNNAIANGQTELILGSGNYSMPTTSGDMTISGTTDTVITIGKPKADNVELNGVTVVGSGNYTGIQHSNKVVYENCVVKGVQFLYADEVQFINCTIDLTEKADYIWTYGAKNVLFDGCTFNTAGKAILVYSEATELTTNVTVKNCTFNASTSALAGGATAAAIEIDSSLSTAGHYTLTTENNIVDSDFSGEWRIKKSGANNTTVNGVVYNAITIDGVQQ